MPGRTPRPRPAGQHLHLRRRLAYRGQRRPDDQLRRRRRGRGDQPDRQRHRAVTLSASSGSVRLLDESTNVVDLVGYGTFVTSTLVPPPTRFEGTAPAPTESINLADFRNATFTASAPVETGGATSIAIPAPVPEPATASLAAAGVMLCRRARKA